MKKVRIIAMVLCFISLAFFFFPQFAKAEDTASGTTGDCSWTIENGVLTITGSGAMADYKSVFESSWANYSITSIVIEEGVTNIGDNAFNWLTKVESVSIPSTVTSIGDNAFYNCVGITNITIPSSVITIGDSAFAYCTHLKGVTIPESVTQMGMNPFEGDYVLGEINVDENNPAYCSKHGVVFDKEKTTLVIFPSGTALGGYEILYDIVSIADAAFAATNITEITIPDTVEYIGKNAFYRCLFLTSAEIPSGVKTIGEGAFKNCQKLSTVKIPSSVTSIGNNAFDTCISVSDIRFYGAPPTLGEDIFKDVTANLCYPSNKGWTSSDLQKLGGTLTLTSKNYGIAGECEWEIIGDTLYIYGSGVTSFMTDLDGEGIKKIVVEEGVTKIGEFTFSIGCDEVESIYIPSTVTSINDFLCSSTLMNIYVDENNSSYCSVDGVVYSKGKGVLYFCPPGKSGTFEIPEGTSSIGSGAFYRCENITGVTFPSTFKTVGDNSFSYTKITDVVLPQGVTTIEEYAFAGCEELKRVVIPASVTKIEVAAFNGCSKLEEIVFIPSSISIDTSDTEDLAFNGVTATAYYPTGGWSTSLRQKCGGDLTWVEYPKITSSRCHISSLESTSDGTKINWSAVTNASGYYIYRSTNGGEYKLIEKITSGSTTSYVDTSANTSGSSYSYKMHVYRTVGSTELYGSDSFEKSTGYMGQTKISSLTATSSGVTIKWSKVAGATGYFLYRSTNGGSFEYVTGITSGSTVSYTDTKATTSGAKYQYKIQAYGPIGNKNYYGNDSDIKTVYFVGRPTISSLTNASTGVTVKWSKVTGATGYYVYRSKNGGTYELVKTITSGSTVSFTDTKATTNGAKYQYKIYAYKTVGSTTYKSVYSTVKTTYWLSKPATPTVTNPSAGKMKITWKKNDKATGYQIKYVLGTTEKTVKITSKSTLTKTLSATKGKTYKVYVRSYKTVSGTTYYSAWSSVKSLKISK